MTEIKKFEGFTTFAGLKEKIKNLNPEMRQAAKYFLKKITDLKYKDGFIEADKKKEGWEIHFHQNDDGEYTLSAYYPVKDTKLSKYRKIEKYETRDKLSDHISCDMDTAITEKPFTIYNVAWYFEIN